MSEKIGFAAIVKTVSKIEPTDWVAVQQGNTLSDMKKSTKEILFAPTEAEIAALAIRASNLEGADITSDGKIDILNGVVAIPGSVLKSIKDTAEDATFTPTVLSGISAVTLESALIEVGTDVDGLKTLKAPLANPTFTGIVSGVTKTMVGLGSVDNTTDIAKPISTAQQTAINLRILSVEKGQANGVATLDLSGLVPIAQLPSYVDDVLEFGSTTLFPSVGESGKIYVATDTSLTYRWSGTIYVEISPSLALGETSSTAYRGDRGKLAYDGVATLKGPGWVDESVKGNAVAIALKVSPDTTPSFNGIKFPTTQVSSADPSTLDDYEEGTWIPTLEGRTTNPTVSYLIRIGTYTKVGNVITVQCNIRANISDIGAGYPEISGLPYVVNASYGGFGVGINNLLTAYNYGASYVAGTKITFEGGTSYSATGYITLTATYTTI